MRATTHAALMRGVSTPNALGDEVETLVVVEGADDFPASIIEKSRREQDPASGIWRTVRYLVGRVSPRISPAAGDVLRDLRDGALYRIEEIERTPRGLSGRASVTLNLRRTAP